MNRSRLILITIILASAAACLWLTSCASTLAKPTWSEVTTHMPDTDARAEHDETQTEDGIVTLWYPNKQMPQRVVYRFPQGGMMDETCEIPSAPCKLWSVKVTGFNPNHLPKGFHIDMPEGTYTITGTDNPYVTVLKDENQMTVGYWATNKHGRGVAVVKDYSYAKALVDLPR